MTLEKLLKDNIKVADYRVLDFEDGTYTEAIRTVASSSIQCFRYSQPAYEMSACHLYEVVAVDDTNKIIITHRC